MGESAPSGVSNVRSVTFSPALPFRPISDPEADPDSEAGKWLEEAVGRILYPEGRRPFIWAARHRAARAANPGTSPTEVGCGDRQPSAPLFGLAPHGVYRAPSVSRGAVRSYRTLSPLPPADRGRSALCGTFPRVAAAGSYPACRLSWSPDLPLRLSPSERPPPPAAPSIPPGALKRAEVKRRKGEEENTVQFRRPRYCVSSTRVTE